MEYDKLKPDEVTCMLPFCYTVRKRCGEISAVDNVVEASKNCHICLNFAERKYLLVRKASALNLITAMWAIYILCFITAWCYASVVYAITLCLSVCLSVTSQCSTKTAKLVITQTTPHDSQGILVFWYQKSPLNSTGVSVTPTGAPNAGGVG